MNRLFAALCFALMASAANAADAPEPGTEAFSQALAKGRVMRAGETVVLTRPGTWLMHQVGDSATFSGYDPNGIPGRFIIGSQRVRFVAWVEDLGEWREAVSIPRGEIQRADSSGRSRLKLLLLQTDRGAYTFQMQREGSSFGDASAVDEAVRLLEPTK